MLVMVSGWEGNSGPVGKKRRLLRESGIITISPAVCTFTLLTGLVKYCVSKLLLSLVSYLTCNLTWSYCHKCTVRERSRPAIRRIDRVKKLRSFTSLCAGWLMTEWRVSGI